MSLPCHIWMPPQAKMPILRRLEEVANVVVPADICLDDEAVAARADLRQYVLGSQQPAAGY